MLTTERERKSLVGKCKFCGATLWYNKEEERLEKRGGDPDCPCYIEGEDGEEEEEDHGIL